MTPSTQTSGRRPPIRAGTSHALRGVALVAALVLAGCSKSSRPHVDRLTVDTLKGGDVIGLEEKGLLQRVKKRMETARFVLLDEDERPPEGVKPWRVAIAVKIFEPRIGEAPTGEVQAVLDLRQKGGDEAFEVETRETRDAKSNDVEDIQRAAVEALELALSRTVNEAAAVLALSGEKDEKVIAAAKDSESSRRDAALRVLVRRRNKAALPLLTGRLSTGDGAELRQVMGMLVELGDPAAVSKLIDASRGKNDTFQREVVFAVGALGGMEAEAYLDTVANGHDDPLVRASAQKALEELKARAPRRPDEGENR